MAAEKKAFDYVNDIWSIADYVRDKVQHRKKAAMWDDADTGEVLE